MKLEIPLRLKLQQLQLISCGKTAASVDNGTKTISDIEDLNYWTFDQRVVDNSEQIPISEKMEMHNFEEVEIQYFYI